MKKISILMLALLPALTGWSQDTVSNPYGRGYFTNNIPDTTSSDYYVGWVPTCGASCGVVTKEMKASQTLRIYGIAACMMSDRDALYLPESLSEEERQEWLDNFYSNFIDTSADELYEYLGIYLSDGDTALVPQREVMIQWRVDTPAYYVATGLYMWGGPNTTYPMYEKFFDSGYVAVSDYFYVGVTQRSCVGTFGTQAHMGLSLMRMSGRACDKSPEYHVKKMCWPEDGYVYWNWDPRVSMITYDHYLIFPILAPDDYPWDTSGVGGDTLAVTQADMVARYVSVQPNPATEQARVLSSFGLSHIEAYNAGGQKVYEAPASGLEAVIDVAPWPRGTYLLRITTPLGTVTKKLLVQ